MSRRILAISRRLVASTLATNDLLTVIRFDPAKRRLKASAILRQPSFGDQALMRTTSRRTQSGLRGFAEARNATAWVRARQPQRVGRFRPAAVNSQIHSHASSDEGARQDVSALHRRRALRSSRRLRWTARAAARNPHATEKIAERLVASRFVR